MSDSPEVKVSRAMRGIADALEEMLTETAGEQMGFSLVVFNTKPGSRINYISNCDRKEVIAAHKSMLKKWEEGMPDVPAHEVE